jgi:antitoxin VapB
MDKANEIGVKTERLQAMLADSNLGGVLLRKEHNFSWLTAGGSSALDISSEVGAAALLVRRDGKRFLLANRIEMPRLLTEEISAKDFEPVEFGWEEEKSSATAIADRAFALLDNKAGGLASDCSLSTTASSIEPLVAQCRYQLTASEVQRLRLLGADAGSVLAEVARSVEQGETEKEVALRTRDLLASRDMTSIVTLVAADDRLQKFRHPVPTDRSWNSLLMIVVCARRAGLIVSLTRIVCVGPVPDELQRRTLATARVNARLLDATRPGMRGSDLYEVAAQAYSAEGFAGEERLHHQGGAAGYRTRDWVAHPASAETVVPHQAFAWNPSITGTKVEETCILNENGVEIVTTSPGWPSISIEGRNYQLPGVLVR